MKKQESLFREEGYQLMGAAFEVYNENGSGLLEEIYQESLEIELALRGIPFRSKQELAVFYKGRELQKRYIPDLHVFSGIVSSSKRSPNWPPSMKRKCSTTCGSHANLWDT